MKKNVSKTKEPTTKSTNTGVTKLKLLVTVVDRSKALYYTDLLEDFEINMQLTMLGHGTADNKTLQLLGLAESEKAVILSLVKEEKVNDVIYTLNEKFRKVKNGKGIAYTIPLKSIIGVSSYKFLINNRELKKEEI